mgnify:CR=1 FL=1
MRQVKSMEILFTIIVPVFNVEEYIDECISSVVKQTYQNVELVLVDDGSTDRSGEKCRFWEENDKRIRYLYQENAGVSAARNFGLEHANGDYIAFVDADDTIDMYFCERMLEIVNKEEVDIVFCEHRSFSVKGEIEVSGRNTSNVVEIESNQYEYDGRKGRRAVWAAAYKRNILRGLKFPSEIAVGEDALFLARAVKASKRIAYYDVPLYNYRIQRKSAYYGSFSMSKYTEIDAWLRICEVFEPESITRLSAEALCADTSLTMLGRYAGDAGFESKYINRLIHVYRSKLPRLIQYDHQKKRKTFKHILYGLFPHIFVKYWGWKNEKKRRNCNTV